MWYVFFYFCCFSSELPQWGGSLMSTHNLCWANIRTRGWWATMLTRAQMRYVFNKPRIFIKQMSTQRWLLPNYSEIWLLVFKKKFFRISIWKFKLNWPQYMVSSFHGTWLLEQSWLSLSSGSFLPNHFEIWLLVCYKSFNFSPIKSIYVTIETKVQKWFSWN